MALLHDPRPDGTGHAIIAPAAPVVPLVFRPRVCPRPAVGSTTGVAVRRGGSGPWPADRHELDPGGRTLGRIPPVLHHRCGGWEEDGPHRRPLGPRCREAAGGRCRPADVRHRRHPDRASRAACARGWGASQPDPRTGWHGVRLRPRVGRPRTAREPRDVGRRRPPASGPAVRSAEEPRGHRPGGPAGVPDQVGAGRRSGAVGGDVARDAGQADVGGDRRGVRNRCSTSSRGIRTFDPPVNIGPVEAVPAIPYPPPWVVPR